MGQRNRRYLKPKTRRYRYEEDINIHMCTFYSNSIPISNFIIIDLKIHCISILEITHHSFKSVSLLLVRDNLVVIYCKKQMGIDVVYTFYY